MRGCQSFICRFFSPLAFFEILSGTRTIGSDILRYVTTITIYRTIAFFSAISTENPGLFTCVASSSAPHSTHISSLVEKCCHFLSSATHTSSSRHLVLMKLDLLSGSTTLLCNDKAWRGAIFLCAAAILQQCQYCFCCWVQPRFPLLYVVGMQKERIKLMSNGFCR